MFEVGQRVEIKFNPQTPDPRVPDQVNGKAPGKGNYQTEPDFGKIIEVRLTESGTFYDVLVDLVRYDLRDPKNPIPVLSKRRRIIPEEKLIAA